jgi:hypothetical protein
LWQLANPGDHAQTHQERLDIRRAVEEVLGSAVHPAPFDAMPMGEGVDCARFLVQLVINYFRFGYDIPAVGGKVQVGMVTYHASQFRMLDQPAYQRTPPGYRVLTCFGTNAAMAAPMSTTATIHGPISRRRSNAKRARTLPRIGKDAGQGLT